MGRLNKMHHSSDRREARDRACLTKTKAPKGVLFPVSDKPETNKVKMGVKKSLLISHFYLFLFSDTGEARTH